MSLCSKLEQLSLYVVNLIVSLLLKNLPGQLTTSFGVASTASFPLFSSSPRRWCVCVCVCVCVCRVRIGVDVCVVCVCFCLFECVFACFPLFQSSPRRWCACVGVPCVVCCESVVRVLV